MLTLVFILATQSFFLLPSVVVPDYVGAAKAAGCAPEYLDPDFTCHDPKDE